jgi:hypothetical protein
MVIRKLGMGSAWIYGLGKGCENVTKRQGRHSLGRNIQWTRQDGGQGERSMSLFSKYIQKQISKRGLKAFILRVVEIAVKLTPSKKDDKMLAKIKSVMDDFEGK